ncbi:MAG TPA: serine/threonine-protein kinase, partial [Thermoleophilaceae bacterium]|nr:serine/threonine-protein kinase [Thermoleophilaceae bacterium]
DERVALKVFRGGEMDGASARAHFKRTVQAQAALSHPNVVAIHDWGTEPAPYLAMTMVQGTTLAEMLANGRRRGLPALEILGAVARGLDAAREQGLVYCRLHPSGVLVAEDGTTMLGDFGAGRSARAVELLGRGSLGAYADYIAPEAIEGGGATPAGNVYALGAMAFHVLAGHPPFVSEYEGVTLQAHLDAPPKGPGSERPGIPTRLDQAVVRALSKDPALRQGSAGELMDTVIEAYAEAGLASEPAADAVPARKRRARRPRLVPALLAVAGVIAAAALGAAAAGGEDPPRAPEPARAAGTKDVRVSHPASWRVARQAPEIAGLRLADPVAVSPPGGPIELVAGRVDGAVPGRPGQLVDLGGVIGRRHSGLRETGSRRPVVAYSVPGAEGTAVAACVGSGSRAARAACERVASTVRPRREGVGLAAASPAYARAVSAVVRRIGAVRIKGRRRLARARTPAGQRRITARLARDYAVLARAMARVEAPAPARASQRVIVSQLRRAARGYRDMSRAARRRSGRRWVAARAGVRSAEGRVQSALRSLRRQGYRVR